MKRSGFITNSLTKIHISDYLQDGRGEGLRQSGLEVSSVHAQKNGVWGKMEKVDPAIQSVFLQPGSLL